MVRVARHALVIVAALGLATAAEARPTCTDAAAVALARSEIERQCSCERAANHHLYVRCAAGVVRKRVAGGLLPRACATAVHQCAARSTCGRSGAVACCLGTRCKPMKSAARCTAKGGHAGTSPSCCDACQVSGTSTTTTTLVVTTTTLAGATTTTVAVTTTSTTLPESATVCSQDTSGASSEPIACGGLVTCNISPAGDKDAFTITLPAAASLTIEIAGTSTPCWDLQNGTGTSVANACETDNPPKKVTGALPAGIYTIIVSAPVGHTSSYVVSVQGVSESFHCGAPLALPSTSLPSGIPLDPPGDTDAYEIAAQGGETVHIVTKGPLQPCWLLFTPGGALEKNSCGANAGDATFGPLIKGTHTLVVRQPNDNATTYSVSVQQVGP